MKRSITAKTALRVVFLIFLIVGSVLIVRSHNTYCDQVYEGTVFGTFYHIEYNHPQSLEKEIKAVLDSVDASLSLFNQKSTLSRINSNRTDTADAMLAEVFSLAMQVSRETGGAFDITVAPLVNLWGFGLKNRADVTQGDVDSIRPHIGWEKVSLRDGCVVKADTAVQIDCGAIAKGYAVDCVARLLKRNGVKDLLVEIGGEIVVEGKNPDKKAWTIGVQKPTENASKTQPELQTVITSSSCALATSGNYNNFYYKDGRRYAHTIDPRTGCPVSHSLLSATVIAPTCAQADAYATAFMVVGKDEAIRILARQPQLKALFIHEENGQLHIWKSEGFPAEVSK